MKLEWLPAKWREKEGDHLIEAANDRTPSVLVCPREDANVATRLSEDIALALGYVAQHGDFHRAALAYAKEHVKWSPLSSTALADAEAETPTGDSEVAALRAEVRRLNELVGYFERSSTARLLGISESQLAAVRGSLGHIRQRWTTVRGAGDGSTQGEVRRAIFGPWHDAIERWVEEGYPLAP
jgi:hypothetical protein